MTDNSVPATNTFRGPSAETELRKRKELRNAKLFATGLLVFATVVYLGMRFLQVRATGQGDHPAVWIGYVRAAAEAGMVGALADWFAVTALFRHPMGIPIPHTAILPNITNPDSRMVALPSGTDLQKAHA